MRHRTETSTQTIYSIPELSWKDRNEPVVTTLFDAASSRLNALRKGSWEKGLAAMRMGNAHDFCRSGDFSAALDELKLLRKQLAC